MNEPVLYEERDDIAIITLNRPHKRNALNEAVIQGLADGIDAATKSADVAAIVLRGADGTLTAGYDLGATVEEPDYVGWTTPYGAKGPKTPRRRVGSGSGLPIHAQQCTSFHEGLGVPKTRAWRGQRLGSGWRHRSRLVL